MTEEAYQDYIVFLVDDDEDDRQLFARVLDSMYPGIEVRVFESGGDLLLHLEEGGAVPDILFLDLNMPVLDGERCLKKLRDKAEYEDICVVIYSESMDMERIENLFREGANRYLRKPGSIGSLKIALERTIASCQNDPIGGLSVINCSE